MSKFGIEDEDFNNKFEWQKELRRKAASYFKSVAIRRMNRHVTG